MYVMYHISSIVCHRYREEEKLAALLALVRDVIPAGRPTLIFASTRHHVDLLAQLLAAEGAPATFVYGTLDQARPFAAWGCTGAQQYLEQLTCDSGHRWGRRRGPQLCLMAASAWLLTVHTCDMFSLSSQAQGFPVDMPPLIRMHPPACAYQVTSPATNCCWCSNSF
jgi:hypothetical protein